MLLAFLLVPVCIGCLLAYLCKANPAGLIGMAPHPFNVLSAVLIIIALDFYVAWGNIQAGGIASLGPIAVQGSGAIIGGYAYFCLCSFALFAGILASTAINVKHIGLNFADRESAMITSILVMTIAIAAFYPVIMQSLASGAILDVASTRTVFFRDHPFAYLLTSLLAPAYLLFLSRCNRWGFIVFVTITVILSRVLIGGRSTILIVAFGLIFKYAQNRRLPLFVLYSSLPVIIAFASYFGYLRSFAHEYSSYWDYLESHGGLISSLFNSPQISFAEAITINIENEWISRQPYSFILTDAIAVIPRAVVPWKGYGASTEFSMAVDLNRWEMVQSEWTITGFANLYTDFGYFGSLLTLLFLGFVWGLAIKASKNTAQSSLFCGTFAVFSMIVFMRTDIYNLCLLLWNYIIVLGLWICIQQSLNIRKRLRFSKTFAP